MLDTQWYHETKNCNCCNKETEYGNIRYGYCGHCYSKIEEIKQADDAEITKICTVTDTYTVQYYCFEGDTDIKTLEFITEEQLKHAGYKVAI